MTRTVRAASLVGGGAIMVAWFVSLGVRASVGAIDPVGPRYAGIGGIPVSPAPLKPLVLPRRDPFAADQLHVIGTTQSARGGIGGMQVPDPSAFNKAGAAALGVIGVIVSDNDAYALVENGAQIQVVHVNDAFAGSTVKAITQNGVVLANGVTLDVDAPRPGVAPGGVATYGTMPVQGATPPAGVSMPGQAAPNGMPSGQSNVQQSVPQQAMPQPVLPIQNAAQQATNSGSVAAPNTSVPSNSALPGPLSSGPSGSLFPLLTPPAQNGAQR